MDQELQKTIADVLQAIANGVGTTVTKLWEVLIRQAYVEGFALIPWVLSGIALAIFLCILAKHCFKEEGSYGDGGYGVAGFFCFVIALLVVVIVFAGVKEMLTCFINPEYWAFLKVISQLK